MSSQWPQREKPYNIWIHGPTALTRHAHMHEHVCVCARLKVNRTTNHPNYKFLLRHYIVMHIFKDTIMRSKVALHQETRGSGC